MCSGGACVCVVEVSVCVVGGASILGRGGKSNVEAKFAVEAANRTELTLPISTLFLPIQNKQIFYSILQYVCVVEVATSNVLIFSCICQNESHQLLAGCGLASSCVPLLLMLILTQVRSPLPLGCMLLLPPLLVWSV